MTRDTDSIVTHTLANGLRIAVAPSGDTAMAAVNILYNTGARDENRNLTGIAHLFEHLMFGGSANVASFDDELERAGGKSNAWTSNDFTNFYQTLPAHNLETAFHLESDRMAFLDISPRALQVQKDVVVEEFKQQCLDRPYGDMYHHLRSQCYSADHPYSWPVIGIAPEHIARATQEDARRWYRLHYTPEQAILAVTGRVDPDEVFRLAEKWFGGIPRGENYQRRLPAPGFPTADTYHEVHADVPSAILTVAYPMDSYGTSQYHAADAITDLLSAGRSARFDTRIVHGTGRGIISSADAAIIGSEHEGLLMLSARLISDDDKSIKLARDLLTQEARRLAIPGEISRREWEKSTNNFEANFRFANNSYISRASNIAQAIYHGTDVDDAITHRRQLTADDIRRHADTIFNATPAVTLAYRTNN